MAQRSDRRKAQTASASPRTRVETTAGSAQKESAPEGQPQDTTQTRGRQNNPCAMSAHSCPPERVEGTYNQVHVVSAPIGRSALIQSSTDPGLGLLGNKPWQRLCAMWTRRFVFILFDVPPGI